MMMAQGSTPNRPELSAALLATLKAAMLSYARDPNSIAKLQPALREIAIEARRKGIHAEQLLVVLKDAWFTLPPVRDAKGDDQNSLLQRVVTMCIREYYST